MVCIEKKVCLRVCMTNKRSGVRCSSPASNGILGKWRQHLVIHTPISTRLNTPHEIRVDNNELCHYMLGHKCERRQIGSPRAPLRGISCTQRLPGPPQGPKTSPEADFKTIFWSSFLEIKNPKWSPHGSPDNRFLIVSFCCFQIKYEKSF